MQAVKKLKKAENKAEMKSWELRQLAAKLGFAEVRTPHIDGEARQPEHNITMAGANGVTFQLPIDPHAVVKNGTLKRITRTLKRNGRSTKIDEDMLFFPPQRVGLSSRDIDAWNREIEKGQSPTLTGIRAFDDALIAGLKDHFNTLNR